MQSDLEELFLDGVKADCMYTDPPWGIGALKMFRKMNHQECHDDWFKMLARIRLVYDRHVKGPAFIEMGRRFQGDVESVFGKPDAIYYPKYGNGITSLLLCYGMNPGNVNGMSGVSLVKMILGKAQSKFMLESSGNPDMIVFDPFVGLGTTAKACKSLKLPCFANELTRDRMLRTAELMPFREV